MKNAVSSVFRAARRGRHALFAAALLSLSSLASAAGDAPGSKDHPLLTRFAGATITAYSQTQFDEAFLPNQPIDDEKTAKGLNLEGKVTRISYAIGAGRSTLEVERNYLDALQKGGFQILFRCTAEQCGKGGGGELQSIVINSGRMRQAGGGDANFGGKHRTILAKLPRASGDAYVFLHIMDDSASNKRALVYEEVVEVKPMQTGQVKVMDSSALQKGLAATGKVALYGIYFDTDKAQVKPESKPQLDEMAKLLTGNPALKVYIVGHTDNQGAFARNADLSQKRAEAVAQALASTYRIAPARLVAKGVASLSPVASNGDDAGRAQNRRVELVQQ
ncbi:cell envelope biogenesis protein OmpA [Burkholderia ubonensis]|uniref:OmpA family protein n=2 Tax=Burkholderia ubonensis TaxID=101571 RepID=UPI000753C929|nr:OmpA family protein [Burkholderia ubonensis]KVO79703.1 cell envelope biogenesis protein OmpA [Burkholderia ubonensis]KVX30227.1 cell envelope biogenesis protein OmpA [Burkholderia ubonensis]KVX88111.1 cell envelope biogenesis protein OmpA [Burkholderia ubonensis]KWI08266.1 cell envelope biogenesis protein OmpA [Burkholderia ubonensis]KWI32909.1 cell envelope biogenesis protein OmpA [Burkholderia ubonensis]